MVSDLVALASGVYRAITLVLSVVDGNPIAINVGMLFNDDDGDFFGFSAVAG
jgi:hypothetical protein